MANEEEKEKKEKKEPVKIEPDSKLIEEVILRKEEKRRLKK